MTQQLNVWQDIRKSNKGDEINRRYTKCGPILITATLYCLQVQQLNDPEFPTILDNYRTRVPERAGMLGEGNPVMPL